MQKNVGKKRWKMEKELWKKWNTRWKKEKKSNSDNRFWCWKKSSKKLNSILKCDLICIVEKTIKIEDYNFE